MVLSFGLAMVLLFVGSAACVFTLAGYFIIKSRKFVWYFAALGASLIATIVLKVVFTVNIIEYTADHQVVERMSIGFPMYKATDGQEIQLRKGGTYLYINSSNSDLVIVPIVYGNSWNDYYIEELYNHSHFFYDSKPDHYMDDVPPEEIYVSGSGSQVKYWLTTLETYFSVYPEAKEEYEQMQEE